MIGASRLSSLTPNKVDQDRRRELREGVTGHHGDSGTFFSLLLGLNLVGILAKTPSDDHGDTREDNCEKTDPTIVQKVSRLIFLMICPAIKAAEAAENC